MGVEREIEREEDYLAEMYDNVELSLSEYNKEVRALHREYRAYAEEAAEEAYDNEMNNWF